MNKTTKTTKTTNRFSSEAVKKMLEQTSKMKLAKTVKSYS